MTTQEVLAEAESLARRAAAILGRHSATAQAVAELDRVRLQGSNAYIVMKKDGWAVIHVEGHEFTSAQQGIQS